MLAVAVWFIGPHLIDFMSVNPGVRETARHYLIWSALTPIAGVLAFEMDGVFIGATWSEDMRNMMLASLVLYLAVWWLAEPRLGADGLWLALLVFLSARGITLFWRHAEPDRAGISLISPADRAEPPNPRDQTLPTDRKIRSPRQREIVEPPPDRGSDGVADGGAARALPTLAGSQERHAGPWNEMDIELGW